MRTAERVERWLEFVTEKAPMGIALVLGMYVAGEVLVRLAGLLGL